MNTTLLGLLVLVALGLVLGILLAVLSKILHVEIDTRVEQVSELLPGVNCGGCGYPGCMGFADAVVEGKVKQLSLCRPASKENLGKILEIMTDSAAEGTKVDIKI